VKKGLLGKDGVVIISRQVRGKEVERGEKTTRLREKESQQFT